MLVADLMADFDDSFRLFSEITKETGNLGNITLSIINIASFYISNSDFMVRNYFEKQFPPQILDFFVDIWTEFHDVQEQG